MLLILIALTVMASPVMLGYLALLWHRANLAHQLEVAKHQEFVKGTGHERFLELDKHHAAVDEPSDVKLARHEAEKAKAEARKAEAVVEAERFSEHRRSRYGV